MQPATLIALVATLTSTFLSAQTVSLNIASGNFADRSGDPVPGGTLWGIVVDTTGEDFGDALMGMTNLEPGSFIKDLSGGPTGFWLGGVFASEDVGPAPVFHPGWFSVAEEIPHVSGSGEAAFGDRWGIIWFPDIQEGSIPYGTNQGYGFFSNPNLTIPSPNSTVTYSDFIGNDIKTADFYFLSDEGGPLLIIPEPSAYAVIVGIGVLLLVVIKRQRRLLCKYGTMNKAPHCQR